MMRSAWTVIDAFKERSGSPNPQFAFGEAGGWRLGLGATPIQSSVRFGSVRDCVARIARR